MNIATVSNAQEAPQLRADNIDQVLNAMTLQEKAQMLVGASSADIRHRLTANVKAYTEKTSAALPLKTNIHLLKQQQ